MTEGEGRAVETLLPLPGSSVPEICTPARRPSPDGPGGLSHRTSNPIRPTLHTLAILVIAASLGVVGSHCIVTNTSLTGTSAAQAGIMAQLGSPGGLGSAATSLSSSVHCTTNCVKDRLAAGVLQSYAHQGPTPGTPPDGRPKGHTEGLLEIIGDKASRDILLSIDTTPRTAHDLMRSLNLPQATIYVKLHLLVSAGLVAVQPVTSGEERRGTVLYLSLLDQLELRKRGRQFSVRVRFRPRMGTRAPEKEPGVLPWVKGALTLHVGPQDVRGEEGVAS